ncbi:MAG: PEGA domain-containing protein [Ignavibacteria bacterium]
MERLLKYILIILSVGAFFTGCATVVEGQRETIKIISNPEGAYVKIDDIDKGNTPLEIDLKKGKEYTIKIGKEGYKEKIYKLSYSVQVGWVVLDAILGTKYVIVDAATGSWNKFDENEINVILEKSE